jgi:hypothetical protein
MGIYVTHNGEELGPYSRAGVFVHLKEGALSSDDPAWCEGMEEWKPLKEVLGGLKPLSVPEPAPLPAPAIARPAVPKAPPVPGDADAAAGHGGCRRFSMALVVVCLLAGGAVLLVLSQPHLFRREMAAPPPDDGRPAQPAEAAQETPAPAGEIMREGESAGNKSQEPDAASQAEAVPQKPEMDLATLAASPAIWPRTVALKEAVSFPVVCVKFCKKGRDMAVVEVVC